MCHMAELQVTESNELPGVGKRTASFASLSAPASSSVRAQPTRLRNTALWSGEAPVCSARLHRRRGDSGEGRISGRGSGDGSTRRYGCVYRSGCAETARRPSPHRVLCLEVRSGVKQRPHAILVAAGRQDVQQGCALLHRKAVRVRDKNMLGCLQYRGLISRRAFRLERRRRTNSSAGTRLPSEAA